MLKKFGFSLLCVAASISTSTYAVSKNNILQAGATIEYELPPNEAQTFSNYMFWEVEANCKIITEDASDVLFALATAKKGKLNDIPWSKGDTLRLTVHHGEILKITAAPGAQVKITNEGEHLVRAICSN